MPLSPEIEQYNDFLVERIVPFHFEDRGQITELLNQLATILPHVESVEDIVLTYRQLLVLANPKAAGDVIAQSMAETLSGNSNLAELNKAAAAWKVRGLARRISEREANSFTQDTAQQLMHMFIDQLVEFSLQNEGIDVLVDTQKWLDDLPGNENQVGN